MLKFFSKTILMKKRENLPFQLLGKILTNNI